jgi:glycine cleavage system H lipoate-binding protein
MPCPFLREARARYCHAASVRKLIVDGPEVPGAGRCATPEYRQCRLLAAEPAGAARCPHLEEVLVQYCGAAPVQKLVPFSDSQVSRCAGESYAYCPVYLSLARPSTDGEIAVPERLLYAPNHLWLDVAAGGAAHIGVDGFLARVARQVERVTFVSAHGVHRPSVVLTVRGVDWPLTFPNPMLITATNSYVRRDPARLTEDPYGAGWLFEGWEIPAGGGNANRGTRDGLLPGKQAKAWIQQELARLTHFAHDAYSAAAAGAETAVLNDGGTAAEDLIEHLERDDIARLFYEFFAPQLGWVREP